MTKIGGVRREFDAEITGRIPDTKVAWVTVGGESDQSAPEGLAENTGDKLASIDRQVKDDLQRFKHFIEDRGAATGEWHGQL
ncbi:hypothetical protein GCM10017778_27520 [Streptomyces vinaceus]|nr:hypothetical protein [Streptomyces vinaceus]GHE42630.1 hypothetical protein GCM10017778_27520 [Streptomyces vinaceus]